MEKLGQLVAASEWDLIVVDTPPSRSALDFLDAPNRLSRFLDGRMIRLLTAPARAGGKAYVRVVTASVGAVAACRHHASSAASCSATCRRSSRHWSRCSAGSVNGRSTPTSCSRRPARPSWWSPHPSRTRLREASYFVDRLSAEHMPLAGMVVNRAHRPAPVKGAVPLGAARAEAAADTLAS